MSTKKKDPSGKRHRNGRLLCKATSKRTRKPCSAYAVKGRDVCYHHGGRTPRGADNVNTIHGRYSKAFPAALAAKFGEALADPELLTLRNEIALIDVKLTTLVETLGERGSVTLWEELSDLGNELGQVSQGIDSKKLETIVDSILGVISEGARDVETWRLINPSLETRRRLVETETKRIDQAAQVITMSELSLVIKSLVEIIKRNVDDESIRRNISNDIENLVSTGDISVN